MCRFKTSPCVGSKRLRVYRQHARMCVWEGGWRFSSLSFSLLFSLSLISSRSCLSPLSATMTMTTRQSGSLFLCTHGSDLPESQSACTLAHSLLGRLGMKWAALCWKWVMCLCLSVFVCVCLCLCLFVFCLCLIVFVCVCLCEHVLVCVVFVVLLVASVLASMRWLLCGGDGKKREKNDICNFRKNVPRAHFCNYFCRDGTTWGTRHKDTQVARTRRLSCVEAENHRRIFIRSYDVSTNSQRDRNSPAPTMMSLGLATRRSSS